MSASTDQRPPEPQENQRAPGAGESEPGPAPAAFHAAFQRFAEIASYARQYFSARFDLARLRVRQMIVLAALGVIGLIAVTTLIVTLVVMLCSGLSDLVASVLGGRAWAGELIVGGGLIVILSGGAWLWLRRINQRHLRQTMARYQQRQRQHREKYENDDAGKASTEDAKDD